MSQVPMVTVGWKNSFDQIITIEMGHWEEYTDDQGRKRNGWVHGEVIQHKLNGFKAQRKLESNGQIIGETAIVRGGYGLTKIPADFWDRFEKENNRPGSSFRALFEQGLIFAHSRDSFVQSQAVEQKDTWSGTEALIPAKFSRTGVREGKRDPRFNAEAASTLER